jgi:hypothetical protein
MIVLLELEWRNHNTSQLIKLCRGILDEAIPGSSGAVVGSGDPYRPWVARITGPDRKFGFHREFLCPMKDYSRSNGKESRGVYLVFALRDGYHEVRESKGYKKFVRAERCEIFDATHSEVESYVRSIQPPAH